MKPQDENVARLLAGELSEAEAAELVRLIGKDPEALRKLGGQAVVAGLLGAAMEDEFTRERRALQVMAAVSRAEQDDFVAGVQTKIQHGQWRARVLAMAALVSLTDIDPGRFVLWLVTFYFTLVMAEAWILARAETREGSS